ncbi:MAG: small heat shock protein Hsp20 [Pedosphaera sp.]|nr:small heat shock protein Hsp20 [Pedosphaera sp.]
MNSLLRWQRPDRAVWPGFGGLFELRNELHRLIESPLAELARGSQLLRVWNPAVDVYEDEQNVVVKAELPGLKKEEIQVSLEDGALSISGERKSEQKVEGAQTYRSERFAGAFQRSITLPSAVKNDGVKADYKDGILTVTLPKAEEAKRKQIEVKIN